MRISISSGSVPNHNLASWRIEAPWRWITAIGVRFSVRQDDLTFGGSNRGGVRVDFKEPLPMWGDPCPSPLPDGR